MSVAQALTAVRLLDPAGLELAADYAWDAWQEAEPEEPAEAWPLDPEDYESPEEYREALEEERQEHDDWERRHREWESAEPPKDHSDDELLDLYLADNRWNGPGFEQEYRNCFVYVPCAGLVKLLEMIRTNVTDNRNVTYCGQCGQPFTARADARYCSNACRQGAYRTR